MWTILVNKCVCRASQSGGTTAGDDDDDDDAGKNRLMTLYVAPTDENCYRRFSTDFTTDNINDNPAYLSLTGDEMKQAKDFDVELSAKFAQFEQFVQDDESISSTFEQLTGGTSDAGRLLVSLLLVIASAFLSILFAML